MIKILSKYLKKLLRESGKDTISELNLQVENLTIAIELQERNIITLETLISAKNKQIKNLEGIISLSLIHI